MKDQHFYADVDLPFHVWVRERSERGFGWVLRDASQMHARAPQAGDPANGTPSARRSAPL